MSKQEFIFNELYESGQQHYLEQKIKDNNDTESKNDNDFATYFWKHIQRYPSNIPECTRCLEDNKRFTGLVNTNMEDDFESNCNRYCLWYDWFDYKRNKIYFIEKGRKINKNNSQKKEDEKKSTKANSMKSAKDAKEKDVIEKSKDDHARKTGNLYGLMLEREDEQDKILMEKEFYKLEEEIVRDINS